MFIKLNDCLSDDDSSTYAQPQKITYGHKHP